MVNYWIFIVKDHVHMGRIIPASEVLSNKVRNKFWSLSARALNLRRLEKGDKVIFYVTEAERKGFMGRGSLSGAGASHNRGAEIPRDRRAVKCIPILHG